MSDRSPSKDIDLQPREFRVTDAPREPKQPMFKPGGLLFIVTIIATALAIALWKTYGAAPS